MVQNIKDISSLTQQAFGKARLIHLGTPDASSIASQFEFVVILNENKHIEECSISVRNVLGYTHDQFKKSRLEEYLCRVDVKKFDTEFNYVLNEPGSVTLTTGTFINKQGGRIYTQIIMLYLESIEGVIVTVTEINEKKQKALLRTCARQ